MSVRAKAVGVLTNLISKKRWNALDQSDAYWRAHDRAEAAYVALVEAVDWQRVMIEAEGHMWARDAADGRTEPADGLEPKVTGLDVRCVLLADGSFIDWLAHVLTEHVDSVSAAPGGPAQEAKA